MVYRMEMVPRFGQRNILQYMVPWLNNIELVEGALAKNPPNTVQSSENYPAIITGMDRVLTGTGWGSLEGTRLVLYNLLSITSKVGGAGCRGRALCLCVYACACVVYHRQWLLVCEPKISVVISHLV